LCSLLFQSLYFCIIGLLEGIFLLLEPSFKILRELEENFLPRLIIFQLLMQLRFLLELSFLISVDLLCLDKDVEIGFACLGDGSLGLGDGG